MSEESRSKAIENIREFIRQKAEEFGAKRNVEFNKPYIERNYTIPEAFQDNGAYFGFVHPEEENSGPYHDFSLTIFPTLEKKPWLVCLGIGSMGFKNDYDLASYPGLRRLFSQLVDDKGFCKSDFTDIDSPLPRSILQNDKLQHIRKSVEIYKKVLPVCEIVDDPESVIGKQTIAAFVAAYAKLRNWPTNADHRKAIDDALEPFIGKKKTNDEDEVINLVETRKFVVLQGAPGTGKTRLAKLIGEKMAAEIVFTQFHAETTYSDFIYGLRPSLSGTSVNYEEKIGPLPMAISLAKQEKQKVLLIIDEINRANLSNVLGESFYLFEHKQDISNVSLQLTSKLGIDKLPTNLYVIATMNTADRSLAVVDFALRRRFAWYTLRPQPIQSKKFQKKDFEKISSIFDWYANSSELSMQPGQGYFLADSEEEMTARVRYELYPLIKEYLQEGLLRLAKEEFNDYFMNRINQSLYE
jgi:hypothetical protein